MDRWRVSECGNGWLDGWMDKQMVESICKWMDVQINGWMDWCVNGWIYG